MIKMSDETSLIVLNCCVYGVPRNYTLYSRPFVLLNTYLLLLDVDGNELPGYNDVLLWLGLPPDDDMQIFMH
jgi:hypothetical protein